MFRWIDKQGVVETEKGFCFQRMHRFYFHYIESEYILKINVEPGLNISKFWIDEPSRWELPHEQEDISLMKLKKIRSNVSKALDFMNIKHQL